MTGEKGVHVQEVDSFENSFFGVLLVQWCSNRKSGYVVRMPSAFSMFRECTCTNGAYLGQPQMSRRCASGPAFIYQKQKNTNTDRWGAEHEERRVRQKGCTRHI